MGTPAPGPPPRTAPAPPRPAPCAPGARRGRRTRPRAQLGADRARHPEADEAPMQPTGQHHPDFLANTLARKSGSGQLLPGRTVDVPVQITPPNPQEAGRTASVADQPAGELPAAATIEAGSTAATTEDIAAAPAGNGPPPAAPAGAAAVVTQHREHRFPGRRRRVQLRFGEEEFAAIELAAGRAGLTSTGYVGAVALAAVRGTAPPAPSQSREALVELMAARAQVRRFGGNVNRAVAALNSTGETPQWLAQAVELTSRAVRRVDEAAEQLMRRRA